MFVELVRTTTRDGLKLDGAFSAPPDAAERAGGWDACVFLHGVGSNFYAGGLFEHLAEMLWSEGVRVLRVNTRGHDSVSVSWGAKGAIRQGAAYEIVDDCRHDLDAWLSFLQQRGYQRMGVIGHSLGAIKAIYCAAFEPHPAVQSVVACSPPRLSYAAFMNSEAQPRFFESCDEARRNVEQGQADALFTSKFPFPILITAAAYLDKYGPEERYNILKFIDRVPCPLLVTYGELELQSGGIAFAGLPEAVLSRRRTDQQLEVVTVPRADHVYTGQYRELGEVVQRWLYNRL